MKNAIIVVLIMLLLSVATVSNSVNALNLDNEIEKVLARDNIKEIVVLSCENSCVVALQLKNMFLDSKLRDLKAEIVNDVKTQFGFENVYVTTSLKEFVKVKQMKQSIKTKNPLDIYNEFQKLMK